MNKRKGDTTNLEALDNFWRRSSFHDELIQEVSALNRRVIIRLASITLIVTGAKDLKRCELPALWLYESLVRHAGGFVLDVETDTGHLKVSGTDVRLIRHSDMAVLIPPIDN